MNFHNEVFDLCCQGALAARKNGPLVFTNKCLLEAKSEKQITHRLQVSEPCITNMKFSQKMRLA
jgi:hypothetical protein